MAVEHIVNGRLWREVGREPYTRKDGTETQLIRWQGWCVKCSAPFEVTSPSVNYETSKSFLAKHCAQHKKVKTQKTANTQENAGEPGADLV